MLVGDSQALIGEGGANLMIAIFQRDANARAAKRVFDRIVEEYQEELMQESFVTDVGNLPLQLTHDFDIFSARSGINQRASLFEHFVDVERLAYEMQLAGIGHRECEQTFHDAR